MLLAGIFGKESDLRFAQLVNAVLSKAGLMVATVRESGCESVVSQVEALLYSGENTIDVLLVYLEEKHLHLNLLKYFKFDVIIYFENDDEYSIAAHTVYFFELQNGVRELLKPNGVLVVNGDRWNIPGKQPSVLSYGFNSSARVTASSVGNRLPEDSYVCFLQDEITAFNGLMLEPQEYRVQVNSEETDPHQVMAVLSLAIMAGLEPEQLS